jgi:hypothetical protein
MSTKIDNQLVHVYIQEALQNAAETRAERNAQPSRAKINGRDSFFALIATGIPVMAWLTQVFKAK